MAYAPAPGLTPSKNAVDSSSTGSVRRREGEALVMAVLRQLSVPSIVLAASNMRSCMRHNFQLNIDTRKVQDESQSRQHIIHALHTQM